MPDDNRRALSIRQSPRLPPYSIEAEQSVLGGLMLDNRKTAEIAERIKPEDFYREDHQIIFTAEIDLHRAGKPTDFVTLAEHLKQRNLLDAAGGMAYLGSLANDTPSAANVDAYAEIVAERAFLRGLITAGGDIAELGYRPEGRAQADLLALLETAVARLRSAGAARESVSLSQALNDAERQWDAANRRRQVGSTAGIPLGLPAIDRATGGILPGDVFGIAARTSIGKTTVALQVAIHAARRGHPGLYVSLEENPASLALRAVAAATDTNLARLRAGDDATGVAIGIAAHHRGLASLPLWIESKTFDLPGILARIARYKRTHGLAFAVIDHIGRVKVQARNGQKRYELVGEVSRSLKETAETLEIGIIPLIQIGRESEKEGRRPKLADLRESGNIEEDLTTCLALHPKPKDPADDSPDQPMEIGLLKNRFGPKAWLKETFSFRGATQQLREIAPAPHDQPY